MADDRQPWLVNISSLFRREKADYKTAAANQ